MSREVKPIKDTMLRNNLAPIIQDKHESSSSSDDAEQVSPDYIEMVVQDKLAPIMHKLNEL